MTCIAREMFMSHKEWYMRYSSRIELVMSSWLMLCVRSHSVSDVLMIVWYADDWSRIELVMLSWLWLCVMSHSVCDMLMIVWYVDDCAAIINISLSYDIMTHDLCSATIINNHQYITLWLVTHYISHVTNYISHQYNTLYNSNISHDDSSRTPKEWYLRYSWRIELVMSSWLM